MANPATKNGFIPIANELAEHFALVNITGQEWRIIWTLLRKTWGWKEKDRRKDWDWVSITQFEKATGMKKANAYNSLKSLLVKRIIVKQENKLKFNQNYNEWLLVKRITTGEQPSYQPFCYVCKFSEALNKHHIIPKAEGGNNGFVNKINLCPNCHALVHQGKISFEELRKLKDKYDGSQLTNTQPAISQSSFSIMQKHNKTVSQLHNNKRKKETITKEIHPFFGDDEFSKLWNDFTEMRKKKRNAPTDKAKQLLLKKLGSYELNTAKKMLENSIERGWQGVFPIKDEPIDKYNQLSELLSKIKPDTKYYPDKVLWNGINLCAVRDTIYSFYPDQMDFLTKEVGICLKNFEEIKKHLT